MFVEGHSNEASAKGRNMPCKMDGEDPYKVAKALADSHLLLCAMLLRRHNYPKSPSCGQVYPREDLDET